MGWGFLPSWIRYDFTPNPFHTFDCRSCGWQSKDNIYLKYTNITSRYKVTQVPQDLIEDVCVCGLGVSCH